VQTMLQECQALGRKRCAGEMSTGPEIKTKGGEGDLIQDLEKAAKDLGLDFTLLRKNSTGKEPAGFTASMSANSFIVDITFAGTTVGAVTIIRTLHEKDEHTDELGATGMKELSTGLLKEGHLMRYLRYMTEQENTVAAMEAQREELALALVVLEADLFQVTKLEADAGGENHVRRRLLEGHGLIRRGFGSTTIEYWAPPTRLIQGGALNATTANTGTYNVDIVLEQASQTTQLASSTAMVAKPKGGLPLPAAAFLPIASVASRGSPLGAQFAMRLNPAVVMSAEVAHELSTMMGIPDPIMPQSRTAAPLFAVDDEWVDEAPSDESGTLQGLLLTKAGFDRALSRASRVHAGSNFLQRWSLGGRGHRGVSVSRVPFSHISGVYPAMQLLRRQHVFNQLFSSCFQPSLTLGGDDEDGPQKLTQAERAFEIIAEPVEMWLQIATMHPSSGHLLSIHIAVLSGGLLEVDIKVMEGDPPIASEKQKLLTHILKVAMDIPLAMDESFS